MFTHYSLFDGVSGKTLRDFAKLPSGGLPELLAEMHRIIIPDEPSCCISVTKGTLHPDGQQMSFGLGKKQNVEFTLILMTSSCVAEHAVELASEGNDSAKLATASLN